MAKDQIHCLPMIQPIPTKTIKSNDPDLLRMPIVIVVAIVVAIIIGFVLAFIDFEIQSVVAIPAQSQKP